MAKAVIASVLAIVENAMNDGANPGQIREPVRAITDKHRK